MDRVHRPAHPRRRRDPADSRPTAAPARRAAGVRAEPRAHTDSRVLHAELPPARLGDGVVSRRRAAAGRKRTSSSTTYTSCSSPRTRGTGAFSSSDGQHSPARGRAATADAMAREFGFRRGALNLVNWVSGPVQPIRHEGRVRCRTRSDPHARGDPAQPSYRSSSTGPTPTAPPKPCSPSSTSSDCDSSSDCAAGDLLLHLLGPPTGLPVDAVMRSCARPQRILEHYDDLL